jgi:hypothetical protein
LTSRVLAVRHDLTAVVVDAHEVERGGDQVEVALLDARRARAEVLEHVSRVGAAEDRVEEPAVVEAVEVAGGRDV